MTYKIVRFYAPHMNKAKEFVRGGLTLEEAQAHCSREDTHGEDWFDGYTEEPRLPRRKESMMERLFFLQTI